MIGVEKTWPIYLSLQTTMAYPNGPSGPTLNTEKAESIAKSWLLEHPVQGPSLIVGPGGPHEITALVDVLPPPLSVLTAHAPEREIIERAIVHVGDMHATPFPAKSFECVFSSNVLEHALSPYVALLECRRILRDGGIAYFIMPSFDGHQGGVGDFHLFCLDERVWRELLRKTGFELLDTERQDGLPPQEDSYYIHYRCRAVAPPAPHDRVLAEVEAAWNRE